GKDGLVMWQMLVADGTQSVRTCVPTRSVGTSGNEWKCNLTGSESLPSAPWRLPTSARPGQTTRGQRPRRPRGTRPGRPARQSVRCGRACHTPGEWNAQECSTRPRLTALTAGLPEGHWPGGDPGETSGRPGGLVRRPATTQAQVIPLAVRAD